MSAMNEFQSVLVIAGAVLSICAIVDLPPQAPGARAAMMQGSPATYAEAKSAEPLKQDGCVRQRTESIRVSTDDGCNDR